MSRFTLPLTLAALVAAAFFSAWKMRATASVLGAVVEDTRACAELASDINSLRRLPPFAVLEAESNEETLEHIQQAADAANLPGPALIRIQPEGSVSFGDSSYQIRPTRLVLRDVTLRQTIAFAHHLVDENRGLTVRDLRLSHAGGDSVGSATETWDVELTLTQLIFSPKSRQSTSITPAISLLVQESPHDESGHPPAVAGAVFASAHGDGGM